MSTKKTISIGVPCYNEEFNVVNTYQVLKKITSKINNYQFKFIFTDNGSLDNTRNEIRKLAKKDKRVIGVFLSRNFGPEASGHALINHAEGYALIMIAADLQDPAELIPKFIKKWEEGYDVVLGTYLNSQDNFIITLLRRLFYFIYKKITNIEVIINSSGFGLVDKKVLTALKQLPEKYRFLRGLLAWIGYRKAFIAYRRKKRERGKTSYNFFDYIKHSERGIFGFSYLVLDLMIYGGFIITFLSFMFIAGYLYWVIVFGNPINASIPLMLAIVFFGGVQLLAISIIGKYIQVIVEETKGRPVYIVEETINI